MLRYYFVIAWSNLPIKTIYIILSLSLNDRICSMINSLLFSLLACFWGGSFIAIKYAISDIPAFTAAFYRVFFASIFLAIIFFRSIKLNKFLWEKELIYVALAGLCSIGIPFSLLFWGEQFIAPSIAGILNGTVPFWTLIIGFVFLQDPKTISPFKITGLFLGLIGMCFIFGPKIKMQGNIEELYGLLSLVSMAVTYGIGTNLNRKILTKNQNIKGPTSLFIQHIVAAIYLGCISIFVDGPFDLELLIISKNAWSIFYLSFFSTSLAFIIFFRLIRELGSVTASSVTFFVPAVALILDIAINGHLLTLFEGIGTIIIFTSMYFLKEKKVVLPRSI